MIKKLINIKIRLNLFAQKGKWQNIVVKVILSELFWLMIICAIIRLVFYSCFIITINTDSETYLSYKANIFLGQVDCYRTPVYPYFIKLIKLFSVENLIQNIVIAQSIISYLTIIVFYKTLAIILKSKKVILLASFTYAILPSIINFDKCILTESVSISAFVVFLYFIVNYLKKPTILKALTYTVYVFFLIMLRPSFIYLMPLTIIFWILRIIFERKELKKSLSGLGASFVCIGLILGYCHLNYLNNGFKGISTVSVFNNLETIMDYNIYQNNKDTEIIETIRNFPPEEMNGRYGIVWNIYTSYPSIRVEKFITTCYLNNSEIYIKKTLEKIYNLGPGSAVTIYAQTKGGLVSGFTYAVYYILSVSFFFIYILLFYDCLYIIGLGLRSKKFPWFRIIIWSIILGQLSIYIIEGIIEPQRIFVEVVPFLIVLIFSYIDMIYYSIDKYKLSNYTKFSHKENNITSIHDK